MSSSGGIGEEKMKEQINELIISGSKYTASGHFSKAAEIYSKLLELEPQNAGHYVLLAKCLYQLGLQKNDMFGGGQDESSEENENEEDDDEDFDSGSDNELDEKKLELHQKLFQFDHEEEEMNDSFSDNDEFGGDTEHAEDDDEDEDEDEDEKRDEDEDVRSSQEMQDAAPDYLKGDVFENAMELLFRARIMYMEAPSSLLPSGSPSPTATRAIMEQPSSTHTSPTVESIPPTVPFANLKFKKDVQLKLVEIYDLLGDIDQELEDFAQSISDYEEAIRYYRDATSIKDNEEIIAMYLKMVESLRWLDTNDKQVTKEKHKLYLQQILELIEKKISSGQSMDVSEDKQRVERLKEDLDVLDKGKVNIKDKILTQSSMMEALLQQALNKSQRTKVNDLSNMVKKKKVRK